VDVKPEEVDRVIREFQESFATVEPIVDRAGEKGDILEFTMETTSDEKKVTALSGKGIRLTVGESRLPPAFDEGLIGMQTGNEKRISYECPPDFWLPELAGKVVEARVNVTGVFHKKLPEVTDEFCKTYFRAESVERAKEDITKRLRESKDHNADAKCREALMRQVVAEMQVDLPDVLVEQELDMMMQEMDHDLKRDKMDMETYLKRTRKTPEDIRKELRESAITRAKSKLALRAIGESEKTNPTPEEIQQELEQVATSEGKDVATFMNEAGSNARLFVEDYLKRRKAIDFVVSKAKIQIRKEEVSV
jgi:trigger factor